MLIGMLVFNFPKPLILLVMEGIFSGFILSAILIYFSEENILSPFFCLSVVFTQYMRLLDLF